MNDDIREVFASALPESEPPTLTHGPELAALGRRRQRHRRIGFAASGATFTVAAVAAAALVVPGLIPGAAGNDQYGAAGVRTETDPEVLSELVREAMAEAFPDVEFTTVPDRHGDEPFDLELERHFDLYYLSGIAGVKREDGEPPQLVEINLIPQGDWTAEPQDRFSDDGETRYLIECADQVDGIDVIGSETSTECGSDDLGEDGVRYTSRKTVTGTKDTEGDTGVDNEGLTGARHISALHRPGDTAVTLFNGCGLDTTDEKTCELGDLIAADTDAVTEVLVSLPKVAAEYPH